MFFSLATLSLFFIIPLIWDRLLSRPKIFYWIRFCVYFILGCLVLFHIFPEILEHSPNRPLAIGVFVCGFVAFTAVEKLFSWRHQAVYRSAIFLSIFGLFIHTFLDGVGLSFFHSHSHHSHSTLGESTSFLPVTIFLHKVPEVFFIWDGLLKILSRQKSWLVMLLFAFVTLVGIGLSTWWGEFELFLGPKLMLIQSFIAGGIFHVILEPFLHKHDRGHVCVHDHDHVHDDLE